MPPPTAFLLAALVVVLWLDTRIAILGRQQAAHTEGGAPVRAWAWLRSLAAKPWIRPVLYAFALVLAAAAATTWMVLG